MASSLRLQNPTFHKPHAPPPTCTPTRHRINYVPVRCGGPRSQRGPLLKGRILSIEAIQAIQTIKRIHRTNPPNHQTLISNTLTRLIKNDLLATLRELLRQQQCTLALRVFSAVRSEYGADLTLYAEMVNALASKSMGDDVDRLILELDGIEFADVADQKGMVSLIKAVVGAGRRESTVRIYEMMKKGGWCENVEPDEYLVNVLVNGLKGFGEMELAKQVQNEANRAFARFSRPNLESFRL
ncbi:protein THYLAKOID ASSEMBLY 8, chloroplastic-like [Arachis stenosperma]|uniref:protein THYLAKOID ASSEMBLY 8, chloroplastic-like n=1 Tax=Arachis stenosperma TaxID=217475 RepID=UPI0025AD243E|nr:protein THYLAKOID ASSEMBLY 8, chloroplastic-like [Arachis stenosperma]